MDEHALACTQLIIYVCMCMQVRAQETVHNDSCAMLCLWVILFGVMNLH